MFAIQKSNCGRPPQPKGWGMQGPPAVILELFSVLRQNFRNIELHSQFMYFGTKKAAYNRVTV